ncbi:hydrogenase expression protein HyaE [Sutterella sp.]|uniref:hydrogenase expression protein HyaE n=1 Tax=Sutterella sp. TaxID=1981025 RepID=UPI0025F20D92|nr:hydrogenase expression protein HyaE [uncultured Sutterella sp.]
MAKFTRVAEIDPATHPLFNRLWNEAKFNRLDEAGLEAFLASPGLKFVIFCADPNLQKETMDIVVIGPEIWKTVSKIAQSAWCTDPAEGRALAARWGVRKLPALAFFRDGVFLGAAEGLDGWDGYLAKLAEIAGRTAAPKRTIAILAPAAEESGCGH